MTRPPYASRRPARPFVWTLAALSLVGLVVSSIFLAQRIHAYIQDHQKPIWFFIRTDQPTFNFAGREVAFIPDLAEDGSGTITLRYAEPAHDTNNPTSATELIIPVEVPSEVARPGLDRYTDWMGVFFFADSERRPLSEFRELYKAGELPVRCAVVIRDPDPGVIEGGRFNLAVDADSWGFGEVMRHRWTFRFHELLPDGTIETTERRFPESGKSFYRRQVRAYQQGEEPPQRAEDELREGTWRWDAALQIMPRPPAITKENQALVSAGWTLPVASASALGLILSLAFALAPAKRTRESDALDEPEAPARD